MRSVTFTFHPDIPSEQQDHVLKQINSWTGVHTAGLLKPGAKNSEVRRMAYAYVKDDADNEDVLKRLSELPEVELASLPTERRLV
jgi:hypothetical protein